MARFGYVAIYKKGTDKQLQTIDIYQAKTSAVTNLSKKGTANSYIITKPGDFKFKAVKGNSAESVGTVAKAEVLWETFNSTQEVEAKSIIAAVGFEGDYITFSTPDNLMAGNALIAAKDATGIILWSWHIWIPETEIATSDFGLGGQTFMDRNLGALKVAVASTTELVDVTSQGLLYSWGRKDPFLAPSTVGGSEMAKSTGTFDMTGAQMTPAESVAKPTTFVSTGSDDVPCWTNPKDDTLWGTEKTLYDPCPPGYKVADFTDKGIWTLASGTTSTLGFSKNLDYKWFKFGDDPCAVFPIVGYFDASPNPAKYANTGKRAYVLSSKASGGYDSVIRVDKDNNKTTSERPARAGSVRCVVDASAVPPATDLSENGTANSYIVSEAGDYKFKAVQGNSTTSVGTIAKAEIVWETNNTATAPEANAIIAKVGVDEGYITFSTPATLVPGNALIAAKDAEGKILWSWHIWIPKTAIKEDTYGLGEVKMMSRALGALVDAEGTDSAKPDITSVGLMYQWGRKDPFMNAGSFFSSTGAHGAATAPADVFKTSATAGATIAYSIENPTEYIKGADDSNTWCSETTDANWAAAKTIYDPCPPGYRVPQSSEVLLLNKAKADIPGWDSSHKAYNWFVCGNPTTQFANAGFIEETGLDHYRSVERVIIWSSTVYTDSKRARCALYNDGSVSADTKQAQARGGIVRCVVDAPAAE
jgi:hypothetical protein